MDEIDELEAKIVSLLSEYAALWYTRRDIFRFAESAKASVPSLAQRSPTDIRMAIAVRENIDGYKRVIAELGVDEDRVTRDMNQIYNTIMRLIPIADMAILFSDGVFLFKVFKFGSIVFEPLIRPAVIDIYHGPDRNREGHNVRV